MTKNSTSKYRRFFRGILVISSALIGITFYCCVAFIIYEDYTYGRIAMSFPREDIETLLDCTEPELDMKCKEKGYRTDWNPILGGYVVKIDAPCGTWLVTMVFDEKQKNNGLPCPLFQCEFA